MYSFGIDVMKGVNLSTGVLKDLIWTGEGTQKQGPFLTEKGYPFQMISCK